MLKLLFSLFIYFCISGAAIAVDDQADNSKHFLLIGVPDSAALSAIVNKPSDLAINYAKELESIGGELVSYYFAAGKAQMYAIIKFADFSKAAAHLYQRVSLGIMKKVEIIEIIPSDKMVDVLKDAQGFNEISKLKGNTSK